jgi:hypothetical protein
MIWILYFAMDGQFLIEHPFPFTTKEECVKIGKELVVQYEAYRCVKELE